MVSITSIRCFQSMFIEKGEPKVISADAFTFDRVASIHINGLNDSHTPVVSIITFSCELYFLSN